MLPAEGLPVRRIVKALKPTSRNGALSRTVSDCPCRKRFTPPTFPSTCRACRGNSQSIIAPKALRPLGIRVPRRRAHARPTSTRTDSSCCLSTVSAAGLGARCKTGRCASTSGSKSAARFRPPLRSGLHRAPTAGDGLNEWPLRVLFLSVIARWPLQ